MKYIKLIFILGIVSTILSCEDFLERESKESLASNSVFEDKNLAQAYLNDIYHGISTPLTGHYMTDNCTDNARTKSGWISSQKIVVPGLISMDNNPLSAWKYTTMRKVNDFIEKINKSSFDNEFIQQKSAEARFIRAYLYFEIVKRYGDAPLLTKALTLEDDYYVPRSSAGEIYDFIDNELDDIDEILPFNKEVKTGQTSKEACWALGSRAMMYAERWAKCIDYSKRVIDRAENETAFTLNPDYGSVFTSYGGDEEVIFEVLYNGEINKGHSFNGYNLPFSYKIVWGSQTNPTQELVDDYYMLSGLPITDPSSGYDPANPYEGRDPRFDATIIHNGSILAGRPVDTTWPNGADRINGGSLYTISGYYIRKYIDEANIPCLLNTDKTSWKVFRLAEIYMNCAEAENELNGPTELVHKCVNKIRSRVNMPNFAIDLNQAQMRIEIRHERRIEFAFEDQRWWDLIRWKKSIEVLNDKYFHGALITVNEDGTLNYDFEYLVDKYSKQVFLEKHYLQPIPVDEITKNPNMTQNPGY